MIPSTGIFSGHSTKGVVSKAPYGQNLENFGESSKHCYDGLSGTETSINNKTSQGSSGASQGGAENLGASRKRANYDSLQDQLQKKKARHFMHCSGQDKYLCEVCSKPDCGECENCK